MRMHEDSIDVVLHAKPRALQGFKSIVQIIRKNPYDTFSDLLALLRQRAPCCPLSV